jgi:hypothetical protein
VTERNATSVERSWLPATVGFHIDEPILGAVTIEASCYWALFSKVADVANLGRRRSLYRFAEEEPIIVVPEVHGCKRTGVVGWAHVINRIAGIVRPKFSIAVPIPISIAGSGVSVAVTVSCRARVGFPGTVRFLGAFGFPARLRAFCGFGALGFAIKAAKVGVEIAKSAAN